MTQDRRPPSTINGPRELPPRGRTAIWTVRITPEHSETGEALRRISLNQRIAKALAAGESVHWAAWNRQAVEAVVEAPGNAGIDAVIDAVGFTIPDGLRPAALYEATDLPRGWDDNLRSVERVARECLYKLAEHQCQDDWQHGCICGWRGCAWYYSDAVARGEIGGLFGAAEVNR